MYTWVCACFACMLVFAVNARHAPLSLSIVPFETISHTVLVAYYLARLCSWWTPETYLSQSLLHLDYSCMWPHQAFLHGFWRSKLGSLSLHSGHFPQPNSFCASLWNVKADDLVTISLERERWCEGEDTCSFAVHLLSLSLPLSSFIVPFLFVSYSKCTS